MKFGKVFLAALLAVVVGSFVSGLFWIFTLIGSMGSFGGSVVTVPQSAILKIDLADNITDSPNVNPLSGFDYMSMTTTRTFSLLQTLRALEAAAVDSRIKGIYINYAEGGSVGVAAMEEIRAALVEFKKSGKFIVAFNDTYAMGGYYFATVADKVYIQPEGGITWKGLGAVMPFYKGALEKLGLTAEVFRPTVCKYKSAVEPYILNKMSDANRRQMQQYIDSTWDTILTAVSESRGIEKEALDKVADTMPMLLPEEALQAKMVDGIIYRDQVEDIWAELGVERNLLGEYEYITLGDYTTTVSPNVMPALPKVGIVYAEGDIVDGESETPDGHIYGNTLADMLAKARKDDSIKAVVLRVNSPGGSALASDVIWREVELLKAAKPVVVSMGDYAASGGYYISAPADAILCNKMTLTGSIGVFGLMFEGSNLFSRHLGLSFDGVKTNTSSDMGNSMFGIATRRNTPQERAMMMRSVDKVYTAFTNKVAAGRNLDINKVLEIAEGRVWIGSDAVKIGLADGFGGLKSAIALAADRAGISESFTTEEVLGEVSPISMFMQTLGMQARTAFMSGTEAELYNEMVQLRSIVEREGVQAFCPYRMEF